MTSAIKVAPQKDTTVRRVYLKGSDYSISRQFNVYPATKQQPGHENTLFV